MTTGGGETSVVATVGDITKTLATQKVTFQLHRKFYFVFAHHCKLEQIVNCNMYGKLGHDQKPINI